MSNTNAALIWSIAELLRGDYKQADYGKVILPFTLLRRLDCVLATTKPAVLETMAKLKDGLDPDYFLCAASQYSFYNASKLDFHAISGDTSHTRANLEAYIGAFSANVRDIFERYDFAKQLDKLEGANLLYQVVQKYAAIDLSPAAVDNAGMGAMFEELIRKFAELSNETAGEHFTPREVIQLIVHCLFAGDDVALAKPGVVR